MANKETRILKNNTLEELRQKSNEISLHLGDNEQLNALMADKTYNYTASAGDVLFSGSDTSSPAKTARFEISPAHTVDNTGGYIILEGVSSLDSSYIAGATIYQGSSGTPSWTAIIVSASTSKILVRDSSGTFSTSADLKVGATPDTIANAKVIRIVIESFPVGIVRVYKNGTELTQGITAAGFHTANIRATISQTGSPTLTNYTEGVTIYQGSEQTSQANVEANATFYGTLHSISDGVIRLKTFNGSLNAGTLIRALGSSDTITGAQHGALTAVDSTYGSYIQLTTPAAASDVIKIFSLDVVAAINELQDDIGTVESLTTAANDLVLAVNEHDAELGTITAGAMGTTASTVSTAIAEHETQIGNVDITGISGSNDNITGALEQLHTEVGNVTSGNLGTTASNLTSAVREHEDQIGNENITTIDSGSNTITGALNQLHTEVGSLSLDTSATDLTAAINEHETDIGNMTLTGLTANNLSAAVRELRAELGDHLEIDDATGYTATTATGGIKELQGDVGDVTSLDTNTTSDLVAAINELENVLRDDTTQRTGYVIGTNANNVLAAINEFETVLRGTNSNYILNTAAQNVRDAINEHESQIGNMVFGTGGPVDAANSTDLSGAVRVLDAEIGDTAYAGADLTTAIKNTQDDINVNGSLTTLHTTNTSVVDAINEIEADLFNAGNAGSGGSRREMSDLKTADKTSILDAINEIYDDIHTAGSVTLSTDANFLVGAINEIEGVFDASAYEISAGSNAFNVTSGTFTIDSAGDVILDSGGGNLTLKAAGTQYGEIDKASGTNNILIKSGSTTMLTGSGANAIFSGTVTAVGTSVFTNLDISGNVDIDGSLETDALSINGITLTATATELNVMDGGTSATSTTLVDADRLVVNDNGTMKQVGLQNFETYFESALDTLSNVTTVGALNAGSITSDFGNINVGTSSITGGAITGTSFVIGSANISEAELETIDSVTAGTVSASKAVVVDGNKDISGFRNITLTGELDAGSLDISGNVDTDGTLDVALSSTLRGAVTINGITTITNSTESTVSSATDGALIVTGGASIGKNLYVGGNLQVEGTQTVLNTETLTVEDTLVLAGNNLSSEPTTGGFGLEVGPITSPSGVAAGVTGAHSIVYNYGAAGGGRWEADGALILSTATLDTPKVEGADFGPSDDLTFSAGAGLSESVTGFAVTYTNTDRGSVAAAALNIFSSAVPSSGTTATADNNNDALNLTQGTGISTIGSGDNIITITNTDLGSSQNIFKTIAVSGQSSIVADSNADTLTLAGADAITITTNATSDTLTIDHDNFGTADTYGQTGTQNGQYIKSIITNAQGHVTAVTAANFDTRYQATNPYWVLQEDGNQVDQVGNTDIVNFASGAGISISSAHSSGTSTITVAHADTSPVADLTSNNSNNTFIQDIDFDFDTFGHVTAATVVPAAVTIGDGITTAIQGVGITLSGDLTWSADQSDPSNFTIAHADTSTLLGSSTNTGRTYIQNLTFDTFGHVTAFTTAENPAPYVHPSLTALLENETFTGVQVPDNIYIQSNSEGHLTGLNVTKRNLTLANFGFDPDTDGWDLFVEGTKKADIDRDNVVNFADDAFLTTAYASSNNTVSYGHPTSGVSSGIYGDGYRIPTLTIDSRGHITSASNGNLVDNYSSWNITADSGGTGAVGSGTTVDIEGSGVISTARTGTKVVVSANLGSYLLTSNEKTASFIAVNSNDDSNDPILRHNDGSNNNVRFTDSGNVTVTYTNSGSINFHGANSPDVDVSVSNLETRLGQIDSNVTIGNSASVNTTISGDLQVNQDLGVSGNATITGNLSVLGTTTTLDTENVTIEDNIILLNKGATALVDLGIEGFRYNQTNASLKWNETTDRWQHGVVGSEVNIPRPSEIPAAMTFNVRDDGKGGAEPIDSETITGSETLGIIGGTAIKTDFPGDRSGDSHTLSIIHGDERIGTGQATGTANTLTFGEQFSAVTGVAVNTQGHAETVTTVQFTMPSAPAGANNGTLTMSTTKGLDGSATFSADQAGSATFTVDLDLTELDDMSEDVVGADDYMIILDNWSADGAGVQKRKKISTVTLSDFSNDLGNYGGFATSSGVTSVGAGTGLSVSPGSNPITSTGTINLDAATSTIRGGIELIDDTEQTEEAESISDTAGRTYGLQVNSAGQGVVNVPWENDTANTTYSHKVAQSSVGNNFNPFIQLVGTNPSSTDDIQLTAGGITTIQKTSDDNITIETPGTNLNVTTSTNIVGINSSTGNNSQIFEASSTAAGVMSVTHHDKLDGIATGAQVNVGTNITVTQTSGSDTVTINSSTGNDGVLLVATSLFAGAMSRSDKAKLDGIEAGATGEQITFSNIQAQNNGTNTTLHSADSHSDTFTIDAGIGLTLTDGTDKITIDLDNDQRRSSYSGDIYLGHAHATAKSYIKLHSAVASGDTGYIDFYTSATTSSNPTHEFRMANNGDFHADGDVVAFSTTTASDAKLKTNVNIVTNALDKVCQLDGVTFEWIRDGKESAGVIAQNVEDVLPSAVKEVETLKVEDETHKAVDYNQLSALFIEAIKELKEENKLLRAEIESLKDINS
tara:strand:+ start:6182 stop:13885 length:7704 start_codon:yes stop_codon:yes gene_type:complete